MLRSYLIFASIFSATVCAAVDFETQILPILERSCIECHGPDKEKAGMRVDSRGALLTGGDSGIPGIEPGKPEESFLIEVLRDPDPEFRMPYDEDPLPEEEIALIEEWIAEGAVWPGQMDAVAEELQSDHWSFQPIERPEPQTRADNPVDGFIADKLKEVGLKANKSADARSLIRRASIVLTGLAPTPERVSEFERDYKRNADKAYDTLVDELMASPHFGERWAQHWLDVIRWAETNGSEANLYRKNAWRYRDYVIRAFNEDKPYDQFVQEQLAGDTMEAGEATGFLVAGPHVPAATVGREPSAIRQARADRMDEVMQTVGASMMGVTLGCARCHNHKFDPISIQDYYSLTGVFQDIEFGGRFPELPETHPRRERGKEIWGQIAQQRGFLRTTGAWEENWGGYRELHFEPIEAKAVKVTFLSQSVSLDELELFGMEDRLKDLALAKNGASVESPLDMITDPRNVPTYIIDGEYGTMRWGARSSKDDDRKPWVIVNLPEVAEIERLRMSSNREYYFETDYLSVPFKKISFSKYRVEVQTKDGKWKEVASIPEIESANEAQPKRAEAIAKIEASALSLEQEGPIVSFLGRFVDPVETRVLHRGSPENPRDAVAPAAPEILAGDLGLSEANSGPERRARLAEWMVAEDNPLTARVMANRIWHHVFGVGIVPTTSDFGSAGALPSHPELLDWLASELREPTVSGGEPWSMKAMIRLLVTSDSFRRSSKPNVAGMEKDAGAALLWRFPPRRVEAEVIRDSILQASGALDDSIGGKSYRIHNEKKTYAQWQVVDNHGSDTWRRMIYQERMRRVDDKMFTAFDFPDCGQVRAKRPVSTTPLQALNLMNSPFAQEQAEMLAARAVEEASKGGLDAQIRRSFQILLNRDPDREELAACKEVAEESGLALVCRSLINSNEFAFLP